MALPPVADWRVSEPYAALAGCDRRAFAWEWLRRAAAYRCCYAQRAPDQEAARFGLHRFESCDLAVPYARPMWRGDADPSVLTASSHLPCLQPEVFDITRYTDLASVISDGDGDEHWLFSDGMRAIRLDVTGSLANGPVGLAFRILGLARLDRQLLALRQFAQFAQSGTMVARLFPAERRARRWALILRVHDASAAGASQREIAAVIFGEGASLGWKAGALSYRSRVRRLQAAARRCAASDPRLWLSAATS